MPYVISTFIKIWVTFIEFCASFTNNDKIIVWIFFSKFF